MIIVADGDKPKEFISANTAFLLHQILQKGDARGVRQGFR
jgi:hypothetical protein